MTGAASQHLDYVVEVQRAQTECVWRVVQATAVTMAGAAPTHHAAERCGAMALATLQALTRIGRRRF